MAEEIDFEYRRISNFQHQVTLTLDGAVWHTVVHHSSTSTYTPNFTGIGGFFCGWTDGHMYKRTYVHTNLRTYIQTDIEASFIRSTLSRSPPKNSKYLLYALAEIQQLTLNSPSSSSSSISSRSSSRALRRASSWLLSSRRCRFYTHKYNQTVTSPQAL